jgi:3-methyladenine DNA glycosylase AlkD
MLSKLKKEIQSLANPQKAKLLQKFFKTGKGEYGEGDIFLGLIVPQQREIVKRYSEIHLSEVQELLNSKYHEYRLIALLILVSRYKKSNKKEKKIIFEFYLKNTKYINNWDLVDLSAPNIVGNFLYEKDKKILYKLANSKNLWEKRIAIISTFAFIKENQLEDSLKISKILLKDKHDLIHKAVGWALREVGKKDKKMLENFLKANYKNISRTTLRYAIEKFPEKERKNWLNGKF